MTDPRQLVVLCMMSETRQRMLDAVKDLRRRLGEERKRAEHARMVRIRHYVTTSCLPAPRLAPWMHIWWFGSDKNFITITSVTGLHRIVTLSLFRDGYIGHSPG
ncbi:hypothetical protein PHYSODRAFT_521770 [Phytophthora sojae]|uniref:Uncharacterized protein n=1 Tax=Phytophthora sojae (strain P6497) TaxID=1094619 RepID=G5A326_PHYSP|nr:hypothetical protein PHYSODRAFT_521770 [Phytophthora sojae]EGZ10066.1 hypothetical protein PHYSODRAFT_521770 [Phytophthora sojae]|eukprot:XP_009534927.1 hypothetical protein PHYSODRAFT_521770 [Phytophthora sojae]